MRVRAAAKELAGDRLALEDREGDGELEGDRVALADLESLGDADGDTDTRAVSVVSASEAVGVAAAGADTAGEREDDVLRKAEADTVFVADVDNVVAFDTLCKALAASTAVAEMLGVPLLVAADTDPVMVARLALAEPVASVVCVELS